jgi:antitoxin component of MazEF toxin-antitoxin module
MPITVKRWGNAYLLTIIIPGHIRFLNLNSLYKLKNIIIVIQLV